MMNLKNVSLAAAPLFIILCSLSVAAQDYDIRLEPLSRAGDKYQLSATASQSIRVKLTSGAQVIQDTNDEFSLKLTADVRVLAVDAKGMATSKSFTITSTTLLKDGATRPLLPQGAVVLAKLQDGHTLFEVNGKPLEEEVAKVLSSAIALHSSDSISDEDMFGSLSRRKVGESWNLNIEAIMAFVKGLGGQVSKENITGTTILKKVENNQIVVHGIMDVANVLLPLSSDFIPEKGEIHSEFNNRLPLVNSNAGSDFNNKVVMTFNGIGRRAPNTNEPVLRINMTIQISSTFNIIPVPTK
jgi:hypothetical protein